MGSTPNWCAILDSWWGPETDGPSSCPPWIAGVASNVVFGTNPPFSIQDFLALYPKYGGTPVTSTGTATEGSNEVTGVNVTGMAVGNPIADSAGFFPDGTTVVSIAGQTITLSSNATGSGATTLTIWTKMLVPAVVLLAYIALATASLVQARWQETWPVAMGWFIAHFLTLWLTTDGQGATSAAQAATQGISSGIRVSKSVGDVSVSYTPVQGLEEWGAWNLTAYGQQLATRAKAVGSGPVLLW